MLPHLDRSCSTKCAKVDHDVTEWLEKKAERRALIFRFRKAEEECSLELREDLLRQIS